MNGYPQKAGIASIRTDAQVKINLSILKGMLRDAVSTSFNGKLTRDGLLDEVSSSTYELNLDLRELLGLPFDSVLDEHNLTETQEKALADDVKRRLSSLVEPDLQVNIFYQGGFFHSCNVTLSGDGVKRLTMAGIAQKIIAS